MPMYQNVRFNEAGIVFFGIGYSYKKKAKQIVHNIEHRFKTIGLVVLEIKN